MRSKKYGEVGPDVDLDREDVRLPSGRRLTNEVADEIAAEITGRPTGRPSLGAHGTRSPQVAFRLPAEQHRRLAAVAKSRGTTVSALARDAVEQLIAQRHAG